MRSRRPPSDIHAPHGRALVWLAWAALLIGGCEAPALQTRTGNDDASRAGDMFIGDAGLPDADILDAQMPDQFDVDPAECVDDDECPPPERCDDGACDGNVVEALRWPQDGVTRVAAAAFDITPEEVETWQDRASADCPDNRPGRFDARVDRPPASPGCADTYDDVNGNGRFDAVWLAGAGGDRPAQALDNNNPPAGRVLLLTRDDQIRVVIVLDVHAVDAAQVHHLRARLAEGLGLTGADVIVIATGNRSGPDAVGMDGPTLASQGSGLRMRLEGGLGLLADLPARSGTDLRWWDAVIARCAAATRRAATRLAPAHLRQGVAALPVDVPIEQAVPDSNTNGVQNDAGDLLAWRSRPRALVSRDQLPGAVDPTLRTVQFEDAAGTPQVVVASWGVAPATERDPVLSADFPGWWRQQVEAQTGAIAVWLPGAADDTTLAGAGAFIPAVNAEGEPVDARAEVVPFDEARPAEDPARALGRWLSVRALESLGETSEPADFTVTARYAWLPLTNPRIGLAARLGVVERLGEWLTGRAVTDAWASGAQAPACGGLGCLRYQIDRIELGPLTWLTVPGALDHAFVAGQNARLLDFGDARNLRDLDGDGIPDDADRDIDVLTRSDSHEAPVQVQGPANPQVLPAIEGLGADDTWIIGRANGGIGSMRARRTHQNVFEGQLDSLRTATAAPPVAQIDLCREAFGCRGRITLGELVDATWQAQPDTLADLPGAHELWLSADPPDRPVQDWHIEDPSGQVVLFGGPLELGPGRRAYIPEHHLVRANIGRGYTLAVGPPEAVIVRLPIGGVVPVNLRNHPNAGDAWRASSPGAGDRAYTVACELLYDGACPVPLEEPMQGLPLAPE